MCIACVCNILYILVYYLAHMCLSLLLSEKSSLGLASPRTLVPERFSPLSFFVKINFNFFSNSVLFSATCATSFPLYSALSFTSILLLLRTSTCSFSFLPLVSSFCLPVVVFSFFCVCSNSFDFFLLQGLLRVLQCCCSAIEPVDACLCYAVQEEEEREKNCTQTYHVSILAMSRLYNEAILPRRAERVCITYTSSSSK